MRSNLTAFVAAFSTVAAFACGGRTSSMSDHDAAVGAADAASDARAHVTLRTLVTGRFVSASGPSGALDAAATAAGPAETFALIDLDGGALVDGDAIRLIAAGDRALSAVAGGGGALTTVATTPGADETFVIVRVAGPGPVAPGDYVSLAAASGAYVSAIDGGGGDVRADAPWARAWEQFAISVDGVTSPPGGTPRQRVLAYLAGISGHQTIAGQHNKFNATPSNATDQVAALTGKTPGLWSADFGFGQDALDHRADMIAEAVAQWNRGAIVQVMYHACIPTRDELCGWDDIGGKAPQHLDDTQWTALVTDGTALNTAWKRRLDALVPHLLALKAAGVAPLFRPLHEMNQGVFWWGGRGGAAGTRALFRITHDYLVGTKGLDHLIWVWDVQDFASLADDVVAYDPGPDTYDVAALDVYDGGYTAGNYAIMRAAAGDKPIAIGECATLPTSAELAAQPAWVFFMLWPDFVDQDRDALPPLYGAPNVITEERMPGWK